MSQPVGEHQGEGSAQEVLGNGEGENEEQEVSVLEEETDSEEEAFSEDEPSVEQPFRGHNPSRWAEMDSRHQDGLTPATVFAPLCLIRHPSRHECKASKPISDCKPSQSHHQF